MRRSEADYHYRDRGGLGGSHLPEAMPTVTEQQPATAGASVELDADSAGGDTERLAGSPKSVSFAGPDWQEGDIDHPTLGDLAVVPRVGVLPRGQVHPAQVRDATAIRKRLRGNYDSQLWWLEQVASGDVLEKVQVDLSEIAEFLDCPKCGEVGLVPKAGGQREVEVRRSAGVKERREAMEQMAKYGLGQLKEVSVENVRERVGKTVALARQLLQPDLAEQFVQAMRPIWKDA